MATARASARATRETARATARDAARDPARSALLAEKAERQSLPLKISHALKSQSRSRFSCDIEKFHTGVRVPI